MLFSLAMTPALCPERSSITMPLNLFLPTAFPHSALNEDPVQQRDLQMSALGLHFLGADISRHNYFWRSCRAAEPLWVNPGQTTGRALLPAEMGGKCNQGKKKKICWENKPQSPSSVRKEGKILYFGASGASIPTSTAAPLVLEGISLTS